MASLWSILWRDVRHSTRSLRRTPAFSAGAVLTVALTVGATTAMFSVVYAVLLKSLPYRDAAQVFWIWSDQPGRDRTPFNVPDFVDYRDGARTLAGLAGYFPVSVNLNDEAAGERVQGLRASGNVFDVLGAPALAGRLLRADDEGAEAEPVVVLTEPYWRRRFAADLGVIGRTIRLDGEPHTVVGVLAEGFATPIREVNVVLPFAADRDERRGARNSLNFIHGVGRLAPGVTEPQAASELQAIARRLQTEFPVENARKRGVRLVGVLDGVVGPVRTALWTVFAAVATVLLIACANLANLLLTRATACRKDVAVRLALGSSRAAVVRQGLIEAWLIGLAGGMSGIVLARWAIVGVVALAPADWPRADAIGIDLVVVLFALAVASIAAVLFGSVPAALTAAADIREGLLGSGRGTTSGSQHVRSGLVAAEVALAVVLLVAMTLLGKSFANVQAVTPGFDAAHALSARISLPVRRFATREAIVTFQRALTDRVRSAPGVIHAGAVSLLPLSGLSSRVPFTVDGRAIERERVPAAQFRLVSPDYFAAAGIPIHRGRAFSDQDTDATRPVAAVSAALARQWLDGLEPIGARLQVDDNDVGPRPIEIVGVVGDVQQVALDADPTWDLYLPYAQIHADSVGLAAGTMFWVVRAEGDAAGLAGRLADDVRRVDADVVASSLRPLAGYLADATASRRFSLALMSAFAMAALTLAATGLIAVVLYGISQRQREIGIRFALGATRAAVVALIMRHGLRAALAGLTLGLVIAVAVARLIAGLMFGVAPGDPRTFVQVAAAVALVIVVACAVPALRAGRLAHGPPPAE